METPTPLKEKDEAKEGASTLYELHFNTDVATAMEECNASSVEEAFAIARDLAEDPDELVFEGFTDPHPINQIVVLDPEGHEWQWNDNDLLLRFAAGDLLASAKAVLHAMKEQLLRDGCEREILNALRKLKSAIDMAEGRGA